MLTSSRVTKAVLAKPTLRVQEHEQARRATLAVSFRDTSEDFMRFSINRIKSIKIFLRLARVLLGRESP